MGKNISLKKNVITNIKLIIYKTKKQFEDAFKKAISNFDESKIWFKHGSYSHKRLICFVLDDNLKELRFDMNSKWIDIWKNYFIEYLHTGIFDSYIYWEIYNERGCSYKHKFPYSSFEGYGFFLYSKEYKEYVGSHKILFGGCTTTQIPKPEYVIPIISKTEIKNYLILDCDKNLILTTYTDVVNLLISDFEDYTTEYFSDYSLGEFVNIEMLKLHHNDNIDNVIERYLKYNDFHIYEILNGCYLKLDESDFIKILKNKINE